MGVQCRDDDETDDDYVSKNHQQTPPDNTTDPSSSDLPGSIPRPSIPGKSDWNESLDIEQGENWLRLVDRRMLLDIQFWIVRMTDSNANDAPYPSVLSRRTEFTRQSVFRRVLSVH
jgi:hypothetical protein